jgi:GNAT superfamily N-acetyltransferase
MDADALRARIEALTSAQGVDLAEEIDEFPALRDAFTLPNTSLHVIRDPRCTASIEDGCCVELIGTLSIDREGERQEVLQFHRVLRVEEGYAEHKWLKVAPEFRGFGISSAFLLQTFALYRDLDIAHVEVEATMETGKWHWGRVGFDFAYGYEREKVRKWATQVCDALGLEDPNLDSFTMATQFARMAARRQVSLKELAEAMPDVRDKAVAVAAKNFLALDEPILLGRLVMLTGPAWIGLLELNGPSYSQFKAYADSKAEETGLGFGGPPVDQTAIRREIS